MKKMLPIAMLTACALLSSSLVSNAQTIKADKAPCTDTVAVNPVAVNAVAANAVALPPLTWPITGTYGAFTYSISGTNNIYFYQNGNFVAYYNFTQEGGKQEWRATIDSSVISGLFTVILNIYGTPEQYNLTFWDF
ncbi:hypothetical protein [Chitinophaga sp. S165]|uniref:hypothetical protein n=1 Tax=Chitinophaga sp. S165 TaxID=2135462 RepID=UPI000D713405|nr:hypothetical protein [Chitinophaga sp. S165]PWV48274.1 hypothetical protein C7475_107180 [Chitinophaga sp. S165]